MLNIDLNIPEKLLPLYTTNKRYIVIYGGRGSGKSWTVADFLIIKSVESRKRILCTREIQKSIKDSVHKLLSDRITTLGLKDLFKITEKTIVGKNGSEFIFKGLRHNPDEVKSTEGIDYCWTEEAQNTSRKSLEILTPTIRKQSSQLLFTYNPTHNDDPIHKDYTLVDRDDTLKIEINYNENPFFPDVLKSELEYDKATDHDKYLHKWEGECVMHSEAQVFYKKWDVKDFETPEDAEYNFGADWGFSKDPTCLIRSYVLDNDLYIDYECYGVGVDIDATPALFRTVPLADKWLIIADSARPETISHMINNGFNIRGAKKGAGSIIDGIQKIRGFSSIYIHPRCKSTIDEFRHYSWKENKTTGELMSVPEDKSNHLIDALRYSLEGLKEYAVIRRW